MASEQRPLSATDAEISCDSSLNTPEKRPLENGPDDGEATGDTFPEGGARAWSVAIGTACIAFCTMGYVNSFGLVIY